MNILRVYLAAEEPLIVSDGSAEGMIHRCLDYIPGNMLLGALAARWKQMHRDCPHPDTSGEFCDIFMNGAVSFGHAVPDCMSQPALPTPLSFEYNKDKGGLPSLDAPLTAENVEKERKEPHVFNRLLKPESENGDSEKNEKRKNLKNSFLDFPSWHVPHGGHIHAMHVAIDAQKRSAQEHMLFGYEAMAAGRKFCSTIYCNDDRLDAVLNLLNAGNRLQVGHSRSAGYGTVRIVGVQIISRGVPSLMNIPKGPHVLYLESAFFPEKSWETALYGLVRLLAEGLGAIFLRKDKIFSRSLRLEGFNGLWRLPRPTRHGFAAGSVITFVSLEDGVLPYALGKWQQEGYGRVQVDPLILKTYEIVPEPPAQPATGSARKEAEELSHLEVSFLGVWRDRTCARLAAQQAVDCVWSADILDGFFKDLRKEGRPSQSQRGNIRRMLLELSRSDWKRAFQDMLSKQPGRQWKSVRTSDPFMRGKRQRDTLDEIMLKLLDAEKVEAFVPPDASFWKLPCLPGKPMTPAEEQRFREDRHRRLLLEILRRWEKEVRTREVKP